MCSVKTIASLLVMLMVGLQSVQSQNWVIVKTPSVKVISETRRVGGVLGKAKKGAALWLREGTVTDDSAHVWFKGRAGGLPLSAVEQFSSSKLSWQAMARTYDLVSLKEEGKVLATMDFEVRDSTLFMCLRWPDSRRGTEIYELARDSYRLVATRAYAGEMPDDMKMFYQTAKSLKYARVFYYDETKKSFFDGDSFYFRENAESVSKDTACFSGVRIRLKEFRKETKGPKTGTGRNAVMPGEQNPEFPGGEKACMAFLSKNIHYPPVCVSEEASGRVYVQFVVEKDGEIGQIRVLRSPHPYLAQEAVRVVGMMPDWKPGYKNGKPVRVLFSLPVKFGLK